MAVESGSVVKKSPNKKKNGNGNGVPSSPPPPKRNKSPGIRVVGGRIYDSFNGKTCHQCRQKTRDFGAACKIQKKNNKLCPIIYCHKCLLNRYGEKAEEAASLGEWSCPKCRGICNCSICMKKRGHQPTGILINMAKASGFASVSDMLLNGEEQVESNKAGADIVTTPKKEVNVTPKKLGKENSFDGKDGANLPNSVAEERSEKRKAEQEGFGDKKNIDDPKEAGPRALKKKSKKLKMDDSTKINTNNNKELLKNTSVHDVKKKMKKTKSDGLEEKNEHNKQGDTFIRRTSPRKLKDCSRMSTQEPGLNSGIGSDDTVNHILHVTEDHKEALENDIVYEEDSEMGDGKAVINQQSAQIHVDFTLPMEREMTSVDGIDVPVEDVGNALQFLEFCAAFGKVLDIKRGQPKQVLQDLFHGRTGRRGKYSLTVQFHILLLSVVQNVDPEVSSTLSLSLGADTWFSTLKECLIECQTVLKAQGLDALDKVVDYETLDASQKLRLLNILCDEVLGTEMVRNWVDDQNTKIAEKVKESRLKLAAARKEEKSLKQKMKSDIAEAITAKHGGLTISEHDAIVSCIKSEADKAHAKVLESQGLLLKNDSQTCDALRTEPVFLGGNGYAYWKLIMSGKSGVLCQNVGKGDSLTLDEKWFEIDDEGKEALEKHLCATRKKKVGS